MASPWCEAVLYSPDPPFLFGGGSGNETRIHTAVETAATAPDGMSERCKSRVQLQTTEIAEIQALVAHERRVLSRPDLHQIKDLFLCFLKILT